MYLNFYITASYCDACLIILNCQTGLKLGECYVEQGEVQYLFFVIKYPHCLLTLPYATQWRNHILELQGPNNEGDHLTSAQPATVMVHHLSLTGMVVLKGNYGLLHSPDLANYMFLLLQYCTNSHSACISLQYHCACLHIKARKHQNRSLS